MVDGKLTWPWPKKALAAISLTYDDGNPNNLDQAIPDLEAWDLYGSFYLTTGRQDVQARKEDWKAAFQKGHEIGNHSVNHPARADAYAPNIPNWLPPEIWLENYSSHDITREVEQAALWLDQNIGPDPKRSYAYPCSATAIGTEPDETSYDAVVQRLHGASRVSGNISNNPQTVDLYRIQSFSFAQPSLADLISYCQSALKTGGWTVLMFHGVGGPSHTTERHIHQALLDYLIKNKYWVAPLRDVAQYISNKRGGDSISDSIL